MPSASLSIRPAAVADLNAINDIYNHYVHHSTCTYQEEPEPIESRLHWFRRHGEMHPIIVAEVDGLVLGWGSLSPYHTRSAYRHTVEDSVYVHHEHHRQGYGSQLLAALITAARALGHRAIIAGIDSEQVASIALHTRQGFQRVGHLREVGLKFGRWLDVVYLELMIGPM